MGLTQEGIPGVSSSLVRHVERGTAPQGGQGVKRRALLAALRWPPDAMVLLASGADPDELDYQPDPEPEPIQIAASGVDLEELRRVDPESYDQIIGMARIALDRARQRSSQ